MNRKIPPQLKVAETLFNRESFRNEVKRIRNLFGIAKGGFDNQEQYKEWFEKKMRLESSKLEEKKLERIIKGKGLYLDVPKTITPVKRKGKYWFWDLELSFYRLIKDMRLPPPWKDTIRDIVVFHNFHPPFSNIDYGYEYNEEINNLVVLVKIYDKVTKEDYIRYWDHIELAINSLPTLNVKSISEREYQVYKWRKEGKDNKWIVHQKEFTNLTENNVSQIFTRLKKLLDS